MQKITTIQGLVHSLHQTGNQPCLITFHREDMLRWSYAEVAATVQQLAAGLRQAGVQRGEYVTLLATNRPEWVFACLAVLSAGAAIMPLDTQIAPDALERVLHDSEARFVFTTTDYLNRLQQLDLPQTLRPILFDVADDDERGWKVLCTTPAEPFPTMQPDDPATLFYTSGTTGLPKGVPLTQHNLAFQVQSVLETGLVQPQDRILMPLPMYHVYPFTIGLLCPLAFGVPIIIPESIAGAHIVRAMREAEATFLIGVPRLHRAVYTQLENRVLSRGAAVLKNFRRLLALSIWLRRRWNVRVGKMLFRSIHEQLGPSVRVVTSGGSALDPELAWKLEGLGWQLAIGYGLTETSPLLTINLPDKDVPRLESVGKVLPGIELRIDTAARPAGDPSENGAASGEGELLARGPSVFVGYRNLPDKTAEVLSDEGWFRTGDLGTIDAEGYIRVSGRASTLIVTEGGKNIQPEPVEDVYQQSQFIAEIGILQDDNHLVALITPDMDEVNRWRNGDVQRAIREAVETQGLKLPTYQRLAEYQITPEPLPKTNLGKIRRHLLQERYQQARQGITDTGAVVVGPLPLADMSERDQALLAHASARQVWELLAERFSERRLTPDTNLALDLGLDSLGWLNLTVEIGELTGVELSEETTREIDTVRDLLQALEQAETSTDDQSPGGENLQEAYANPEAVLTDEQKHWLSPKGPMLTAASTIGFMLNKRLMKLGFRVETMGLEHLPDGVPFVLAPNHISNLDPFVLAAALPAGVLRQTYWAGSNDMFTTSAHMRLFSRITQLLPVAGAGTIDVRSSLAFAVATLKRQHTLVWFPEGRLSPDGTLLPFRQGLGIVLHYHPVPVVPVIIQGTRDALPRGNMIPRLRPVKVTFGEPCDPRELEQQGSGDYPHARIVQALHDQATALATGQPAVAVAG